MSKSLSRKLVDKPYSVVGVVYNRAACYGAILCFHGYLGCFFAFKYKRNPRLHIHDFTFGYLRCNCFCDMPFNRLSVCIFAH